jgi:hypothetical protein
VRLLDIIRNVPEIILEIRKNLFVDKLKVNDYDLISSIKNPSFITIFLVVCRLKVCFVGLARTEVKVLEIYTGWKELKRKRSPVRRNLI